MNKIHTFLVVSFLAAFLPFGAFAQKGAEVRKWSSSNTQIQRSVDGKLLNISFSVIPDQKISSQEIIYIYPSLESVDKSKKIDLEPLSIVGSKRAKVVKRSQVLKNKLHLPLVKETYPAKFTSIEVTRSLPFERWMAKSRLVLREEVFACAECEKLTQKRDSYEARIHLFSPNDYRYSFVEPEAVAVKRHEERFESKVNFVVARHELKKDYKNNASELARLDDFVTKALNLEGTTLDVVNVEGYASPEGDANSNQALSERRAEVLARYVRNKYPEIGRTPDFKVKGLGSDWEGLRRIVEESNLSYRNQVLRAIEAPDHWSKQAALLRVAEGKAYEYLLATVYPSLRRTTFRMGYKVRPFMVGELPRIFAKKPELMSNQEHYLLAQEYIQNGKNPLVVFASAYRLYPGDVTAALNYANALLKYDASEVVKVLQILRPFSDDLRTAVPSAIAEHMLGNENAAEAILTEAANKGCKVAQSILGR